MAMPTRLLSHRNKWFATHRIVDLTDSRVGAWTESEAQRAAEAMAREALARSERGREAARLAYDLAYSGGNHREMAAAGHPRD